MNKLEPQLEIITSPQQSAPFNLEKKIQKENTGLQWPNNIVKMLHKWIAISDQRDSLEATTLRHCLSCFWKHIKMAFELVEQLLNFDWQLPWPIGSLAMTPYQG